MSSVEDLIINAKKAIEQAQGEIRKLDPQKRRKNKYWTQAIRSELATVGKNLGYHVYPDRTLEIDRSEWLYDVCWIDYGCDPRGDLPHPSERRLRSVELILESEWLKSDGDFLDDFEKLLQARAKLRVMIFGGDSTKILDKRCALAKAVIAAYRRSEQDTFLLIWVPDDSQMNFECRRIETPIVRE